MLKKISQKIANIKISIYTIILLGPFWLSNLFGAQNIDQFDSDDDGMIYSPMFPKYGGPPIPFDIELCKLCIISGTVKSKDTNIAVPGIKLKILNPETTAITDESGFFTFELYNLRSDTFELEIRDENSGKILHTNKVIFSNPAKMKPHNFIYRITDNLENSFEIRKETLEIYL